MSEAAGMTIEHVSDTAFLIAECRALESARPDALFKDPLAAVLSGDKGKAIIAAWPRPEMTRWMTAVRTVIIDRFLRAASVDAVVNLGAGLDTRPYRLDLPRDLLWIEADYPHVIAFKEERLRGQLPRCRLERVGIDLADGPARRAFLASVGARAKRILVLTEGVVPYLSVEEAGALADDLRALPQIEGWIVDYVSPRAHAQRARSGVTAHLRNAPFKFQPADWAAFFASHGWTVREMQSLAIEGARLGRRAPLPFVARALMRIFGALRPGAKDPRHFAGYALLGRAG